MDRPRRARPKPASPALGSLHVSSETGFPPAPSKSDLVFHESVLQSPDRPRNRSNQSNPSEEAEVAEILSTLSRPSDDKASGVTKERVGKVAFVDATGSSRSRSDTKGQDTAVQKKRQRRLNESIASGKRETKRPRVTRTTDQGSTTRKRRGIGDKLEREKTSRSSKRKAKRKATSTSASNSSLATTAVRKPRVRKTAPQDDVGWVDDEYDEISSAEDDGSTGSDSLAITSSQVAPGDASSVVKRSRTPRWRRVTAARSGSNRRGPYRKPSRDLGLTDILPVDSHGMPDPSEVALIDLIYAPISNFTKTTRATTERLEAAKRTRALARERSRGKGREDVASAGPGLAVEQPGRAPTLGFGLDIPVHNPRTNAPQNLNDNGEVILEPAPPHPGVPASSLHPPPLESIDGSSGKQEMPPVEKPATLSLHVAEETSASAGGVTDKYATQLRLVDGELVVDVDHLVVTPQDTQHLLSDTVVHEHNSRTTSASFRSRPPSASWTTEETDKFFKALEMCNTDLTLVAQLFPERNRRQIKTKFKREEKVNRARLLEALDRRAPLDLDAFRAVGMSISDSVDAAAEVDEEGVAEQRHSNGQSADLQGADPVADEALADRGEHSPGVSSPPGVEAAEARQDIATAARKTAPAAELDDESLLGLEVTRAPNISMEGSSHSPHGQPEQQGSRLQVSLNV